MARGTTQLKRTKMKTAARPKTTKTRQSARDEECTIRLPGICNYRTDTTVLCHSNNLSDGKGMGLKAPDHIAAYGCCACHDVVDGRAPIPPDLTREGVAALFREAIEQTQRILRRKKLLKDDNE